MYRIGLRTVIYIVVILSTLLPLRGSEVGEDEVLVRARILDPDGKVVPEEQIPESLFVTAQVVFHSKDDNGRRLGSAAVDLSMNEEGVYRFYGPIPWHRVRDLLDREGIPQADVKAQLRVRVEGGTGFPYIGAGGSDELQQGEEFDLDVRLEVNERWLPKNPAHVVLKLVSSVTGDPLVGWRLRNKQGPDGVPVTDDEGLVRVPVADVGSGLEIWVRKGKGFWGIYPEGISARIEPEAIRQHLEDGSPITVLTDEPLLVVDLFAVDSPGARKRIPYPGYLLLKIFEENGERHISIPVRYGYGVLYPSEAEELRPGMRVEFVISKGFDQFRLMNPERMINDDDGPHKFEVEFESAEPRDIVFTVSNANTGEPIAGAEVMAVRDDQRLAVDSSDDAGRATLEEMPWVAFDLVIRAEGFEPIRHQISASRSPAEDQVMVPLEDVSIAVAGGDSARFPFAALVQRRGAGGWETYPSERDGPAGSGFSPIRSVPARSSIAVLVDPERRAAVIEEVPLAETTTVTLEAPTVTPLTIVVDVPQDLAAREGYRVRALDAATGIPLHKEPGGFGREAPARVLWNGRQIDVYVEGVRSGAIRVGSIFDRTTEARFEFDPDAEHEWIDLDEILWKGLPQ